MGVLGHWTQYWQFYPASFGSQPEQLYPSHKCVENVQRLALHGKLRFLISRQNLQEHCTRYVDSKRVHPFIWQNHILSSSSFRLCTGLCLYADTQRWVISHFRTTSENQCKHRREHKMLIPHTYNLTHLLGLYFFNSKCMMEFVFRWQWGHVFLLNPRLSLLTFTRARPPLLNMQLSSWLPVACWPCVNLYWLP